MINVTVTSIAADGSLEIVNKYQAEDRSMALAVIEGVVAANLHTKWLIKNIEVA